MTFVFLGAFLGTAHAAEPVLYMGDNPNVAVAQVVLATGKGAHEFAPVSVSQFLGGHEPLILGMGSVTGCAEEPTAMSDVSAPIGRAEKAIAYLDSEAGLADLGAAAEKLACLGEPLVPEVAARLHVLRGVLYHFKGDKPAAWEEYSQAFGFDSEIKWDPNFPPESQKIFELASGEVASSERVTLTVVPGLSDGTLLVDGRAIPGNGRALDVQPGPHIVQVISEPVLTLKVVVEPGAPTTLVIPSAIPSDAPAWAADSELQPGLSSLTEALWERDWVYYVVALGGVWKAKVGSGDFEVLTSADERRPMVLTGVPAGSSVIFGLKDGGTKSRVEVAWDDGEIEGSLGLRIAGSVSLDAAAAGVYAYTISNRLLGDIQGEFTVSEGVSGLQDVDWSSATNHGRVRDAWSNHQDATARYEKAGVYRMRARAGQGVAAVGGAIAAYGLGRYLGQNGTYGELADEVNTLIIEGDPDDLSVARAVERDAAQSSARVGLTFLGAGAGVSVAGLGFAQLNTVKGRKGGPKVTPWEPETLDLPEPEPVEEAPAEEAPGDAAEESAEPTSATIGAPPEAPAQTPAEEAEPAEEEAKTGGE